MIVMTSAITFLDTLNAEYVQLHKEYEDFFWLSYMGDHKVDAKKNQALGKRDAYRSNAAYAQKVEELLVGAEAKTKARLTVWLDFFKRYQSPPHALGIKNKIDRLEATILKKRATRTEGYIDPYTKKFTAASAVRMSTMLATNDDEKIRRACFEGREKLATDYVSEYVQLITMRNQYAHAMGYTDFYDFKVRREDGMTKEELFTLFDSIYQKTKYAFDDIRTLEKNMPGLRKPWNFRYMMSGDFTKEEDPYFQFEEALPRWGRSFAALGIDYNKGVLTLDLLDRKGKWNNGFCHWPLLNHYKNGKFNPGTSNFTCNVVAGQVGTGVIGYNTLFHEGGHAAHFLNTREQEVILNNEYSPMSTSWAETQSMFLDTIFSSVEWKIRYATDAQGNPYPFELFERKTKKLHLLKPGRINSILFVSNYEKDIYETKNLTVPKVLAIAKKNYRKYYDFSADSLAALNIPHIYSWESSGAYHGYGLAELALTQWRAYFYKKYGYIVDNPKVGKEMAKVWQFGSKYTFNQFVVLATGQKLSAQPFLDEVTASVEETIRQGSEKVKRLSRVKKYTQPVRLNATIKMVHGKIEIANNKKSFEDMASTYKKWLLKQIMR